MGLAEQILDGDRRALARALTWIEDERAEGTALLAALAGHGSAHRIGVTGPPGAGKSTLVSALVGAWRARGHRVAVLAVDPSSPFSGGALLGDRIRMLTHAEDEDVFIRSLASRGALGGLAAAVHDATDLLEAAGFDPVLIETVGVGQAEVDVCSAADTTVVVLAPGAGDVVQAMKAGLVEVADVLVVNQADRDGAEALQAALRSACALRAGEPPPILATVATRGEGVDALRAMLEQRLAAGAAGEGLAHRRHERARARIRSTVDRRRAAGFWSTHAERLDALAGDVAAGRLTAAAAVKRLMAELEEA